MGRGSHSLEMSQVLLVSPGLSWFIGVGHLPVPGRPAAGHSEPMWATAGEARPWGGQPGVNVQLAAHTLKSLVSWDQCSIDATVKNSQEWRNCITIGLINVYPWDGERLIFVASERSQSCQDKRLIWEDNQDYIRKGNVVLRCMDIDRKSLVSFRLCTGSSLSVLYSSEGCLLLTGHSRHDTHFILCRTRSERLPSGKDIGKFIKFFKPLWSH